MDESSRAIRYNEWMKRIHACAESGMTKSAWCEANGVNEKQFYYYLRRIRTQMAEHYESTPMLPEDPEGQALVPVGSIGKSHRQEIVKIPLRSGAQESSHVVEFTVNGLCLHVEENISASFLAKLLEAAKHGAR